jgi:hypothetical protein
MGVAMHIGEDSGEPDSVYKRQGKFIDLAAADDEGMDSLWELSQGIVEVLAKEKFWSGLIRRRFFPG